MFVRNEGYKQLDAFASQSKLTKKQTKLWDNSVEHKFFECVFTNINESLFSILYSDKKSRPNVPVNQMVGALILKHLKNWTYDELFTNLSFNMLTRHAIGINRMDIDVFSEASIYNFQTKIVDYFEASGIDLINTVFETLTASQIKHFDIKTNIQRGDSFLVGSNIVNYSRIRLVVEVLQRLKRVLTPQDKDKYCSLLEKYSKNTASHFSYKLSKDEVIKEIENIGFIYHQLVIELKEDYKDDKVFGIFYRVYNEYFRIEKGVIKVRAGEEITSSCLMSPDDEDATFRKKRNVKSKGFVAHVSETIHPDNKINLITDVVVEKNNVGDAEILENRLPVMIKNAPDLDEYFSDGGYGSPNVDKLTNKHNITQYQTAFTGRKSPGQQQVETDEEGQVWATCGGGQRILAEKQKRWKAEFDWNVCETCPLNKVCKVKIIGGKLKAKRRVYYFEDKEILSHARMRNMEKLPIKKRTLRANVEATVKEMKRGMKNGKVRVRKLVRVSIHMILTAIGINLVRIAQKTRYMFSIIPDSHHRVTYPIQWTAWNVGRICSIN